MDNFDLRKYLAEGRLFKEEYDPYDDYDNMDFSKLNPGQKAAFDEWLVQYSPDYFENKAEFQDMIDEFAEVENANDLADFVHDEFAGDKYERLVFIRQLEKAYLDDDQPLDEGKLLKEQLMPKKISDKPFTIVYPVSDMTDYEDYDIRNIYLNIFLLRDQKCPLKQEIPKMPLRIKSTLKSIFYKNDLRKSKAPKIPHFCPS